jgi:hypothetical protein
MSRKRLESRLNKLERANQAKAQRVLIVPSSVEGKGPKAVAAWIRDHGFESPVMLPDVRPTEDV